MKHMNFLSLFFLSFILTGQAVAQQPSFNCGGRLSPNERLICNTPQLAQMDNSIAHLFGELTSMLNRAAADITRSDQRNWVRNRQSCRSNLRCTRQLMNDRISVLQRDLAQQRSFRNPPPPPPQPPVNNPGTNPGNQTNCGFFNMKTYQGRCVRQCPENHESGPDNICHFNEEMANPNPCGPGFYQIKGLCISSADVQENNSFCGPGFLMVQNKCIHQNDVQFRP